MTHTFRNSLKIVRTATLIIALALLPVLSVKPASAAAITSRSVTLSTAAGGATGVTYTLNTAALPSATPVRSLQIEICTTVACVGTPSGFSGSSATLASQPTGLGAASGWSVSAAAGSLRITHASNSTAPSGAVAVVFNAVTNPTAVNTTYYGVITTYSDSAWTTAIDTGTVALSTSQTIQVALTVNETLTFCTGTSITGTNCGTIAGSTVSLGAGSTTATSSGTSVFAASTNGTGGYTVTVNGSTLTSGSNTIAALASGGTSTIGTPQYGLNLVSNTTPSVGAAVSGTGTATAATNYGTSNTFRFATGETVASVGGPSNANAFTVSYIANISGLTAAGNYVSNLNYVATANF